MSYYAASAFLLTEEADTCAGGAGNPVLLVHGNRLLLVLLPNGRNRVLCVLHLRAQDLLGRQDRLGGERLPGLTLPWPRLYKTCCLWRRRGRAPPHATRPALADRLLAQQQEGPALRLPPERREERGSALQVRHAAPCASDPEGVLGDAAQCVFDEGPVSTRASGNRVG